MRAASSVALLALALAMCAFGARPYARFLAWATTGTRAAIPPAEAPLAVQERDGAMRVVGARRVATVRAVRDPAGALVDPQTLTRAAEIGLDPARSLADNDSTGFFEALGDLLQPGPTLTNVNDCRVILIEP